MKQRLHMAKTPKNLGMATFRAYCNFANLSLRERKQDYTITDLIADVLTFARSKGFDTEDILLSAANHVDAETVENCPKCGHPVTRENALTDLGEGEEEDRIFYYCSERCRETH